MKLYTLGYEQFNSGQELTKALPAQVILLDVRRTPFSYITDFTREALARNLGQRYRSYPVLGNAQKTLPYVPIIGATICLTSLIAEMDEGTTFCLFCKERDPKQCHRLALAEQISAQRWGRVEIIHL